MPKKSAKKAVTPDTKMLVDRILYSKKSKWRTFKWLQNGNLKQLDEDKTQRLINSLSIQDFVAPFYVWFEEKTGTTWILDGCHREKILHLAELQGKFTAPDELTAIYIDCKSRKEAAELVLVYSAVYAQTTKQGLFEFAAENAIDITAIESIAAIPMIEAAEFEEEHPDAAGLNSEEQEKEFDVEVPEDPFTQMGDLYEIHSLEKNLVHRILCGDCLDTNQLTKLMNKEEASMIFVDPPYNVSIKKDIGSGSSPEGIQKHDEFAMASGEMSITEFQQFLYSVFRNLAAFSTNGSIHYACMDWKHVYEIITAGQRAYTELKNICVWAKNNGGMGTFYRSQHELIFVFKNGQGKHINNFKLGQTGRYRTNIWEYPIMTSFGRKKTESVSGKESKLHPTPKPVAMVYDCCLDCSHEKDIVMDTFLGSGTTLIACEQALRQCRATEIAPKYVDVSVARYMSYQIQQSKKYKVLRNGVELTDEEMNGLLNIIRG